MKKNIIYILIIGALPWIYSCKRYSDDSTTQMLRGEWIISGLDNQDIWSDISKIEFKKNHRYYMEYKYPVDYDVSFLTGGSGNYYILENPNRRSSTILFIPDYKMDTSDTIRPPFWHFDIVKLDDSELHLGSPTYYHDEGMGYMPPSFIPVTLIWIFEKRI